MAHITSRQQLTTLCERAVRTWPDVRAILLFGSRAKGTARPDSDWDIAVVVEDPAIDRVIHYKRDRSPPPFDAYTNLDVLTLTPALLARDRYAFGRIAQQIGQDGIPLIGDGSTTPKNPASTPLILPKEWGLGITTSLNHMTSALNEIERCKTRKRYDFIDTHCRSFVVHSQESAEHLVKTMLKRRRVPPARTHDLERLAAQMRDHRPDDVAGHDWSALADRITTLNGDSSRDHQAGYGDYRLTAEDITHAAARLSKTFRLLVDEVESALYPHDAPATMGLGTACLGDDPHQFALAKAGRAIHANIQSLQANATGVMARADTPKTAEYPPDPGVKSFLAHCQPLETMISPPITDRVAARGFAADPDNRNPFALDTDTPIPSPFDP